MLRNLDGDAGTIRGGGRLPAAPLGSLLIITADDFGLHPAVNQAVRRAHVLGPLTAASLMVQAPASAEAVELAHSLPDLRVGLHLVLTDGWSSLPHERYAERRTPGRLEDGMVSESFRFAFSRRARNRMTAEIRAQFEQFRRTGLTLDHVNAHKHFHVHPLVLQVILSLGQEFGPFAVRVPAEPRWFAYRCGGAAALACNLGLSGWLEYMKHCLRAARHPYNDHVFGLSCSGHLDSWTMLDLLSSLPGGVSEVYLHPALRTGAAIAPSMPHYQHAMEMEMLMSPPVLNRLSARRIRTGSFLDIPSAPSRAPHDPVVG